jgi:hypothetical protein
LILNVCAIEAAAVRECWRDIRAPRRGGGHEARPGCPGAAGLSELRAGEITNRLKRYIDAVGGLVTQSELEVARELVRRARRLEELEARLRGGGHGGGR